MVTYSSMLVSLLLITVTVTSTVAQNPNIQCADIKPLQNLTIQALYGKWQAREILTFHHEEENGSTIAAPAMCIGVKVRNVSSSGLGMKVSTHVMGRGKMVDVSRYEVEGEEQGRWHVSSDVSAFMNNSEMLVIAANPSKYLVLVLCQVSSEDAELRSPFSVTILTRRYPRRSRHRGHSRGHAHHFRGHTACDDEDETDTDPEVKVEEVEETTNITADATSTSTQNPQEIDLEVAPAEMESGEDSDESNEIPSGLFEVRGQMLVPRGREGRRVRRSYRRYNRRRNNPHRHRISYQVMSSEEMAQLRSKVAQILGLENFEPRVLDTTCYSKRSAWRHTEQRAGEARQSRVGQF